MGTQFAVELELARPSETDLLQLGQEEHAIALSLDDQYQKANPLKDIRILLVEDHVLNLKIACKLLEHQGATVYTAPNGQEALNWLFTQGNTVDIVLMDIQMPIMDGNTAVTLLRSSGMFDTLPVTGLTGGALLSEREKSLQAGMNDYLTKPLNPDQIISVIRNQIDNVQKMQAGAVNL